MHPAFLLKLSTCLFLAGVSSVSGAKQIDRPATKDSTILRSTVSCQNCPERNCYKCTLGHNNTLQANTGGLAYIQSLVGFELPVAPSTVKKCTVQFPAFTKPLAFEVNVTFATAQSSSWDENTVTGENAPASGAVFRTVTVPASNNLGPVDITPACKAASYGQFSIYVGTQSGFIEIWSKDSGNPAILHTYQK